MWSDHIQIICKEANSVLGFFHRNFNTRPVKVKSLLYQSLLRPILEYACTIWALHSQTDIQSVEAVQRRAARTVMESTRVLQVCWMNLTGPLYKLEETN